MSTVISPHNGTLASNCGTKLGCAAIKRRLALTAVYSSFLCFAFSSEVKSCSRRLQLFLFPQIAIKMSLLKTINGQFYRSAVNIPKLFACGLLHRCSTAGPAVLGKEQQAFRRSGRGEDPEEPARAIPEQSHAGGERRHCRQETVQDPFGSRLVESPSAGHPVFILISARTH